MPDSSGNEARIPSDLDLNMAKTAVDTLLKQNSLIPLPKAYELAKREVPAYAHAIEFIQQERMKKKELIEAQTSRTVANEAGFVNWYSGPSELADAWLRYRGKLSTKPGMGAAVDSLDEESTAVVSRLADPKFENLKKKGLVLGYVQSGKTSNYTAVIAKAVDAGYRMVIVLAGMHNALRDQTHERLNQDLDFSRPAVSNSQVFPPVRWLPLTDYDDDKNPQDISRISKGTAQSHIKMTHERVIVAVVKKNASRLRHLDKFLDHAAGPELDNCPVLIIDDESDQATPNTEEEDVSTINGLVRSIWKRVSKGTYVAYTATPFANLLMDPDDENELYPSDFIYAMHEPSGYMGASYFFDDSPENSRHSLIRSIPKDQVDRIDPPGSRRNPCLPQMVESLKNAIRWFILATAIRHRRGYSSHSSMLVHTTMKVERHSVLYTHVSNFLEEIKNLRKSDRSAYLEGFELLFNVETDPELGEPLVQSLTWTELEGQIDVILDSIEVVEDNSTSADRLTYHKDRPRNVIAIGGNTLSRGLTLEGLVVSFFTRRSKNFDTLLQMSRWFGFRPNYEDLVRVWLGPELQEEFAFLSQVENELREEINQMIEDHTRPRDVGIKIRTHPGRLDITSSNKMHHAEVAQISLQGRRLQTFRLLLDRQTASHNMAVTRDLLSKLERLGFGSQSAGRHHVVRDVPTTHVKQFFQKFKLAERPVTLASENTLNWLERFGSQLKWNIVLVSGKGKHSITLTDQIEVSVTIRAKLRDSKAKDGSVSIKTLIAPSDLNIDVPHPTEKRVVAKIIESRSTQLNNAGLILIYVINKDSPASTEQKVAMTREDLGAEDHVPAFGVVFPKLQDANDYEYVKVRIDNPTDFNIDDEDDD